LTFIASLLGALFLFAIAWIALGNAAAKKVMAHRARNVIVMMFTITSFLVLLLIMTQIYGNSLFLRQQREELAMQIASGNSTATLAPSPESVVFDSSTTTPLVLFLCLVGGAFFINACCCACGPSPFGALGLALYTLLVSLVCAWRVYEAYLYGLGQYTKVFILFYLFLKN